MRWSRGEKRKDKREYVEFGGARGRNSETQEESYKWKWGRKEEVQNEEQLQWSYNENASNTLYMKAIPLFR